MKAFVYSSIVHSLLGASAVMAAIPLSSLKRISNIPTVPNKFIVEVDTTANIPNKRAYTRTLDAVYDSIKARDVEFNVDKEYEAPGLFVGASLTINSTADAVALDDIPGLINIYPVRRFQRPSPVELHVVDGSGDSKVVPPVFSSHVATGVDKVHEKGYFGKDIKIGILDTGIDYTHPVLGGGIGPGKKIAGGYDFVGDDYTGFNDPVPDDDPLDQCYGHGTHVAGIIAADPNNPYNIRGVAYESTLYAYRIFGCQGEVTDDVIVDALLRGVDDGVDILNLSLGGPDGWTSSLSSVVASRIARSGKIVTISAGNDGAFGSWYTSSPGNGIDVISVGSAENAVIPVQKTLVHGVEHEPISYYTFPPLAIEGEWPIYVLTPDDLTVPDDACSPLPDSTPDLSPYIVIVRRGTCPFPLKVEHLRAKGASKALFYDNGEGPQGYRPSPSFPASLISAEDGLFLIEQFKANASITLSFPRDGELDDIPNPSEGLMSAFSSYGPTNDFFFKPAVSAPGGNIVSLLPVPLGNFGVASGTSMSAPFVAGASALLLQVRGKTLETARNARTLFETTAVSVRSATDELSLPQTLTQQGAGLINVYDALFSSTSIDKGELLLNDTANYQGVHTFTLTNKGDAAKAYTLSHQPAGTALTVQQGSILASHGPVPLVQSAASVDITPSQFTLQPGGSQQVVATFTPPSGLDATRYPVYSGFIRVAGPGENFHVPYMGLAASLQDKQVVDNTEEFFGERIPAVLNSAGATQTAPINYTFVGEDYPTFVFRLAFGSRVVRLDVVRPDIEIDAGLNVRAVPDEHSFTFPQELRSGSLSRVEIVGPIAEWNGVSRNNDDINTNGAHTVAINNPAFANGTAIPNGSYRLLFRALKVTGDHTRQEDYETWLSPIVGVFV